MMDKTEKTIINKNLNNIVNDSKEKLFFQKSEKIINISNINKYSFFNKIRSLSKIICLLLAIYFIYVIFFQKIFYISNDDIELSKLINTDKSYTNESINEILEKSKQFVNLTNMGILLTKIPKKIKDVKISVIIPAFNSEKYILKAIRSVQNQNFKELEIILIDDNSYDNSLEIMEQLADEDPRIKVIKNEKNSGMLYSRSIGVLYSKGKYIIPLDSDDFFLIDDLLDRLFNEFEKSDVEIINYRALSIWNISEYFEKKNVEIIRQHKYNYIMYQPKLSYVDGCILWSQIFKKELYKKAIDSYGNRIYNYINFYEDCIMNTIIHQLAKSAKFLLKFGILHINRMTSSSRSGNKISRVKSKLFSIESKYDFNKYMENRKDDLAIELNYLIRRGRFLITLRNEKNKLYLKSFIKRIYKDNKVSNNTKKKLLNTCIDIRLINNYSEIIE